jgi:putative transposase
MLQSRLGLSQRRACVIVGRHRSTQRHAPAEADPDRELRDRLRRFARAHPRWGYRRADAVLRREGHAVNRKKIQRLWRDQGLARAAEAPQAPAARFLDQPRASGCEPPAATTCGRSTTNSTSPPPAAPSRSCTSSTSSPASPSPMSSTTPSTRMRPSPAWTRIVGACGRHAEFIRCDNSPELTANALRDWCRFGGAGVASIEPGSPWENPWVESYGSRMRDELLAIEQFASLLEAQVLVADWRTEYNTYRPHSALGMLTPAEYADQWKQTNPPNLS